MCAKKKGEDYEIYPWLRDLYCTHFEIIQQWLSKYYK